MTKPMIDSYHSVWFELHEDLLATLGIERGSEPEPWKRTHREHSRAVGRGAHRDGHADGRRRQRSTTTAWPRWRATCRTTATTALLSPARPASRPSLTDEERVNTWRAAAEAVTIPIIAGSGTNDTAHSVEMTKAAQGSGRGGDPGGDAVLQPALAGGPVRPLHGDRRVHRPAGDALRHPDSHRAARSRTRRSCSLIGDAPNIVANKDAAKDPVGHGAAAARRARLLRSLLGRLVA